MMLYFLLEQWWYILISIHVLPELLNISVPDILFCMIFTTILVTSGTERNKHTKKLVKIVKYILFLRSLQDGHLGALAALWHCPMIILTLKKDTSVSTILCGCMAICRCCILNTEQIQFYSRLDFQRINRNVLNLYDLCINFQIGRVQLD